MELWIITGLVILVAFLYLVLRRQRKNRHAVVKKEIEETLEAFVEEVERQNEELLASVAGFRQQLEERITALEKKLSELQALQQSASGQAASTPLQENKRVYARPQTDHDDLLSLQDRYAKVFELHGNGMSPAEIARATGSGKGEVELILQLFRYGQNN